ncbi:MAG: hypothetical protein CM15mP1_2920 [Methanobacteriota archaeon]|nr:MAG: hypothetical protein CM15mP1_2920 [Euryarchaeota archaeon]
MRLLSIAENLAAIENLPSLDLTWLGAHSAPPGRSLDDYYEEIISEQLPAVITKESQEVQTFSVTRGWFTMSNGRDNEKQQAGGQPFRLHMRVF